jgi:hypothetical protein
MAKRNARTRSTSSSSAPSTNRDRKTSEELLREATEALAKLQGTSRFKIVTSRLTSFGLLAMGLWWFGFLYRPGSDSKDMQVEVASSEQLQLAKQAIPEKQDRIALGVAMETIAELLQQDATKEPAAISTREQVSEKLLAETLRAFVLAGGKLQAQKAAEFFASHFDSEEEFPQKAGPLEPAQRAMAVKQLRRIAAACKEAH